MSVDPRVQKFYDEAVAAKKELRRLASEIASHRIELADLPVFPTGKVALNSIIIPDVAWSLENGRTDLAVRLIELADQYNNSMGTAAMMQLRVDREEHEIRFRESLGEGAGPEYLDEACDDGEPIRLSGEEAAALFSTFPDSKK